MLADTQKQVPNGLTEHRNKELGTAIAGLSEFHKSNKLCLICADGEEPTRVFLSRIKTALRLLIRHQQSVRIDLLSTKGAYCQLCVGQGLGKDLQRNEDTNCVFEARHQLLASNFKASRIRIRSRSTACLSGSQIWFL